MKHWIIVGGGYRGIVVAHLLAKAGNKVTLAERAGFLGGVMHSPQWEDIYVDYGCHVFDNSDDRTTDLNLEIMEGDVFPVDVVYASVTDGKRTDGIAIPNFTLLDSAQRERLLEEILAASDAGGDMWAADSLDGALRVRYGDLAAELIAPKVIKIFGAHPRDLDPLTYNMVPFSRLYAADDDIALELKKNPAYDGVLAASSQSDPMKFYRHKATHFPHRNFYPSHKGMRGFCEKALAHLKKLGVKVMLEHGTTRVGREPEGLTVHFEDGGKVTGDHIVWTLGGGGLCQALFGEDPLAEMAHAVPAVMYYFAVGKEQINGYTYIQDFTHGAPIYRASVPGLYGNQFRADGGTYICLEAPTEKDTPLWDDPESFLDTAWEQAVRIGLVSGSRPEHHHVLKLPVTFKPPKKGFGAAMNDVRERVTNFGDDVILVEQTAFTKDAIYAKVMDVAGG
jgi:protoporphyrinogen oxidase